MSIKCTTLFAVCSAKWGSPDVNKCLVVITIAVQLERAHISYQRCHPERETILCQKPWVQHSIQLSYHLQDMVVGKHGDYKYVNAEMISTRRTLQIRVFWSDPDPPFEDAEIRIRSKNVFFLFFSLHFNVLFLDSHQFFLLDRILIQFFSENQSICATLIFKAREVAKFFY